MHACAGGIIGGGWAGMGSRTMTELLGGRWQAALPRRYGGYFRNDQEHRDFVAIGVATGEYYLHPQGNSNFPITRPPYGNFPFRTVLR